MSIDGSVWSEGRWGLNVSVTVRRIKCAEDDSGGGGGSSPAMTVEHLLNEMDQLRYIKNSAAWINVCTLYNIIDQHVHCIFLLSLAEVFAG